MIERICCLVIGYIFGLFQTGYIVGKIKGIDIRNHGSGNVGTTNMVRTLGLKYGLIVLAGDIIKCGLAILLTKYLFGADNAVIMPLLVIYTASGAILGHNFPFFMHFKGGKGLAATAGFVIFGLGPKMTLICLTVFLLDLFITHYVSLGAILVYATLLISSVVYWKMDIFAFAANGVSQCYIEYMIILVLLTAMMLIRHSGNITRLLNGTERKTYLTGKSEIDVNNKETN